MKTIIPACIAVVLVGTACDSKKPTPEMEPGTAAQPSISAPKDGVEPAAKPADDDEVLPEGVASLGDEEWCKAAHIETVKLVEGIRESLKANSHDESEYELPDEATYLAECGKLPVAMRKCLVISYSTANQQRCLDAEGALDADARAAYGKITGKP